MEEAPGATRIPGTTGRRRLQACSIRTPRIRLALRYTGFPRHSSCKTTWPSIHTKRSIQRTRACTSHTRRRATTPGEAMRAIQALQVKAAVELLAMQATEGSWAASCWKTGYWWAVLQGLAERLVVGLEESPGGASAEEEAAEAWEGLPVDYECVLVEAAAAAAVIVGVAVGMGTRQKPQASCFRG